MHDARFGRNGLSVCGHPVTLLANHPVLRRNFFIHSALLGEKRTQGRLVIIHRCK